MRVIDADKLLRDIEKYHVSDGRFQHWVQIQPTIEPEPCEDAVSRTELRHIFEEHCYPVHYDHNSVDVGMTLPGIVEVLNIAPSVAPKQRTGKWVYKPNEYDDSTYECSQCEEPWTLIDGTPEENNMNFCPNCGAEMNGGEQE